MRLVSADAFAGLLTRIQDNTISGKIAKEVFEAVWAGEGTVEEIIEKRGLTQISDSASIDKLVDAQQAIDEGVLGVHAQVYEIVHRRRTSSSTSRAAAVLASQRSLRDVFSAPAPDATSRPGTPSRP